MGVMFKKILLFFYWFFLCTLLSLRYRIKINGLETLSAKTLTKPKGILFLSNHPAEIDPLILLRVLWPKYQPHPVAIEYLFHMPLVRYFIRLVGGIPFPNFDRSSNSFKRKQMEKSYQEILSSLRKNENILLYPSGGLKDSAEEVIGGASGVHAILQQEPLANIVLVRIKGLWGSSFSRAPTGKTPDILPLFFKSFIVLLKNLIFFAPRRTVIVECSPAPSDFPVHGDKRAINQYLEQWFNQEVEPLQLVSLSRFKNIYPKIIDRPTHVEFSLTEVAPETRHKVFEYIATLTKKNESEISDDQNLTLDLGLDSLDLAQVTIFLKEEFGIAGVQSSDLITVGHVLGFAARLIKVKADEEEEEKKSGGWVDKKVRPPLTIPEGRTLIEVFLKKCERMGSYAITIDFSSGELSYKKMKIMVIALSQLIRKIPDKRIGILLPASVAANILILAVLFADKVPVMLNWTLGINSLRSVVEQASLKTTISSWAFLDRLENVELDGLEEQIICLEDFTRKISIWDRSLAVLYSMLTTKQLIRRLKLSEISENNQAVILFTSGTEGTPKGVPLTHKNLLSNLRSAFQTVSLESDSVLLGSLPPFHSFGFAITGIFPLIAGVRVAYSPNPLDGKRLSAAIERWQVTLLCMAPSFLKNVIRVASTKQLKKLRLIVLGAEKTPKEIYQKIEEINPTTTVIEGYGITECSPILTLNLPQGVHRGVGRAIPGISLAIINPETGEPKQRGEQGLILAAGPNIFGGYLDPEHLSPFIVRDGITWYNTGDLGYLDPENFLFLTGRLKRFTKIAGEMVSLGSIEDALMQAAAEKKWPMDPEIPSLAICALEEEEKKSEIHLFVTFDLSVEEANRVLKDSGMSNLIRIRSVKKIPYIPLLGTGKIDYRSLSDRLKKESTRG